MKDPTVNPGGGKNSGNGSACSSGTLGAPSRSDRSSVLTARVPIELSITLNPGSSHFRINPVTSSSLNVVREGDVLTVMLFSERKAMHPYHERRSGGLGSSAMVVLSFCLTDTTDGGTPLTELNSILQNM